MSDQEIKILDYGCGNIGSLRNMLRHIGASVQVVSKAADISSKTALILPGVGNFGHASEMLKGSGLADAVVAHALHGRPLLGVCVGMQLLLEHSSEGNASGLGLIAGKVRHFDRTRFNERLPLPHVGWSYADPVNEVGHRLLANMPKRPRFYFVHSYHAECADPNDAIMVSTYGYEFTCAVSRKNITGFQFHPEKSHAFGLTLLSNWIRSINE